MILTLSPLSKADTYTCCFDWPENVPVQARDSGIVFAKGGSYTTAFFEAFPPDTFIRGEGNTIAEAKQDAWRQFSRIRECPNHEFERRGYENGVGFCKQCGLFKSDAFLPTKTCQACGTPTFYSLDADNNAYCKEHVWVIPLEKWSETAWMLAYDEYLMWRGKTSLEKAEVS